MILTIDSDKEKMKAKCTVTVQNTVGAFRVKCNLTSLPRKSSPVYLKEKETHPHRVAHEYLETDSRRHKSKTQVNKA